MPEQKAVKNLHQVLVPLISTVVLLLLLELLHRTNLLADFILPAPSLVFRALVRDWAELWPHLLATLQVSILGLFLATIIGLLLAFLLERFSLLYELIYPLLLVSQNIPTIVLAPIVIMLFGYGLGPRLVVVILVCFFPISLNTLQGLASTDPDQVRLLQSLQAGYGQIMWHVKIPQALPAFFSGLKISATYCVSSVVLAESTGSGSGLGVFMMRAKRSYAYDRMFASIILIIALSTGFYLMVRALSYLATPWLRKKGDYVLSPQDA